MDSEFLRLKEVLLEAQQRGPVYYVSNAGNLGDALIRHGTLKFFEDIGLQYKEMPRVKTRWIWPLIRGGTVLYGGGGAWCNHFASASRLVEKLAKRFHVIVLPSSFELTPNIPNVTYFCRDRYESQQNVPEAIFCHDLALYIGDDHGIDRPGEGVGFFFRTDRESAGLIDLPPTNIDISKQGRELSDGTEMFRMVADAAVIHTDRLHVSIAALLIGREVHMYPGRYFKNRAIYESSLKDRFEKVHFHPDFSEFDQVLASAE